METVLVVDISAGSGDTLVSPAAATPTGTPATDPAGFLV